MQHPVTIAMQFICYAGCITFSGLFAMAYKVDPARAITLSMAFGALAVLVLIKNWKEADADTKERRNKQ